MLLKKPFNLEKNRLGATLFYSNFLEYFEELQTQWQNLYTLYFIPKPGPNKK